MGNSELKAKVEKRSELAIWFNNLFRTKLEIESDKLLEMMQQSNDNQVRGNTTFYYSRAGLQTAVEAKLSGSPKFVPLRDLSVTYWCDVPKKLWREFQDDTVFNTQLYDTINKLTDRLVGEWAKRQTHWETLAEQAAATGDQAGVDRAIREFAKDCVTLGRECEVVAIEKIAAFFSDKVQTYGDYTRYKVRAGAKLASTFVGVALSLAATATAGTPVAPATLVPAIVGLVSSVMSIGMQIKGLAAAAEDIEEEIVSRLANIEIGYKDSNGKARKGLFKARELGTGFLSGASGGFSDLFIPSIKALLDDTGLHKSKLDGLDVSLHEMSIGVNGFVDVMVATEKVLSSNLKALAEKAKSSPGNVQVGQAQKAIDLAREVFGDLNEKFLQMVENVAAMLKRIEDGRASNTTLREALEQIQKALGTGGYALAGNILATLTLTGIGFSSGLPSDTVEKITNYSSLAWTGVDQIREYSPDAMEKILG
jgi:hypothetical protein